MTNINHNDCINLLTCPSIPIFAILVWVKSGEAAFIWILNQSWLYALLVFASIPVINCEVVSGCLTLSVGWFSSGMFGRWWGYWVSTNVSSNSQCYKLVGREFNNDCRLYFWFLKHYKHEARIGNSVMSNRKALEKWYTVDLEIFVSQNFRVLNFRVKIFSWSGIPTKIFWRY